MSFSWKKAIVHPGFGIVLLGLGLWGTMISFEETRYCLSPSWRDWVGLPATCSFLLGSIQFLWSLFSAKMHEFIKVLGSLLAIGLLFFGWIYLLFGAALKSTALVKKYELNGQHYCLLSGLGGFGKSGLDLKLYDMKSLEAGPVARYFIKGLNSGEPDTWHEQIRFSPAEKDGDNFVLVRDAVVPANVCHPFRSERPCLDFPYTLRRENTN